MAVEARGGLHWAEWACELAGTALLVLGGLSAVCLDFGTGSPVAQVVPDHSARLLITGILFAGTGSLVTISPIGRRSGAHLNPAVSLAFWLRRHMHPSDLGGYVVSQCVGAILGTLAVRLLWGAMATSVDVGVTQPRPGLGDPAAAAIEALMTAILVGTILGMVASSRLARWTPLALWVVIAVLVWQGAPFTDTSLNPARSLGPALLEGMWANFWVYVAGPLAGAAAAVAVFDTIPRAETKTAKLFHDPTYPTTMRSLLPVDGRVSSPAPP